MDLQTIRESLRKATDKAAPSPHTASVANALHGNGVRCSWVNEASGIEHWIEVVDADKPDSIEIRLYRTTMFRRPASGDVVSRFTRRWAPGDSDFRQWLDDELAKLVQMHKGDQAQRESSTSKRGLAPVQPVPIDGPRPASLEPAAVLDTVLLRQNNRDTCVRSAAS
jgi:hypothetical protein